MQKRKLGKRNRNSGTTKIAAHAELGMNTNRGDTLFSLWSLIWSVGDRPTYREITLQLVRRKNDESRRSL